MSPPNDRESQRPNPPLPQESAHPNRSHGEEASLIALGMASAALLHQLSNLTGLLGVRVGRLKEYINSNDRAALDLVTAIEKTISSLSELSAAVEVLREPSEPPMPLDVNSLLYEVWEELSASHTSKTVRVSFDFPEDVPPVRADSHLLAEVFRAVLENSIQATSKKPGHIDIHTQYVDADNTVRVEIADNGTGIPQLILADLFQGPIPSTGTNKGLGLWLAHLILARFGGEISVKHTEIGHGTTIAITLPVIKAIETPTDSSHD